MIGALTLIATLSLSQQPTPEDDAAYEIYQAGRDLLEAGNYAEASEKLAQAYTLLQNPQIRFHLGRAYALSDRCDEAITLLVQVRGQFADAPPRQRRRLEAERSQAEQSCRLKRARAADIQSPSEDVRLAECQRIAADLEALARGLSGEDRSWQRATVRHCRPYQTAFATTTPIRRAAYRLYQAAVAKAAEGKNERAIELYGKALEVLPTEPAILRAVAWLHLAVTGCDPAVERLQQISMERQSAEDRHTRLVCTTFAPAATLAGLDRVAYVRVVVATLKAQEDGDAASTLAAWSALANQYGSATLWNRVADLLFEAGDCTAYLQASGQVETLGGQVQNADQRQEVCRSQNTVDNTPVLVVESDHHGGRGAVWGWVAVGTGVVSLSVSAYFLSEWVGISNTTGAANEAEQQQLGDDSETYSTLAWSLGAAGVGLAGTGIWLLLRDSGNLDSARTVPWIGPGLLGVSGRF